MRSELIKSKGTVSGMLTGLLLLLAFPIGSFAAGWQWMTPQRVMSLVKEGSGLWLVDIRGEADFASNHIEGAVHIPIGLIATKRLPKGKVIVVVDDSLGLRQGREAGESLVRNGHDKVFLLEGGLPSWQDEKYPVVGQKGRHPFRRVMPDDITWARDNRVPLRLFDLRDKGEQARGPIMQAVAVEGNTLAERLEKVREMLFKAEKGLAGKLEKPATAVVIFPASADAQALMERSFRGEVSDVRFMEGGYAEWAVKPDKSVSVVGTCPTCSKGTPGGAK